MPATGLAARCTACGTVFRVVPDQLRVSEGWVRCGRCAEVFNASENLVDIETGAPLRTPEDWPQPGRPEAPQTPEPDASSAGEAPDRTRPFAPPTPDAAALNPDARDTEAAEATATPERRAPEGAEGIAATDTKPAEAVPAAGQTAGLGAATPSFLRQAERAQRWRQPRVRAALVLLALFGVLGLVAQVMHTWRDRVAAHFPATRPLLEQLCNGLGCTVPAVREIHSLTVESSGLVRVERSNVYKLQAVLRNRAGIELAIPALELSLTDAQGRLAVRKVLPGDTLGVPDRTLGAGRELNLQATLQVVAPAAPTNGAAASAPDPRPSLPTIAGYTIELFYP